MVKLCCAKDISDGFLGAAELWEEPRGTLTYTAARKELNTYTTTLHAINSAVVKLSKLTVATKVYRGVSGRVLPAQFWEANAFGVRGGVEGGFMSCTLEQGVAMSYAASGAGFVFEIQQGMVDRGADIGFLSQYPHEREILCVAGDRTEDLRICVLLLTLRLRSSAEQVRAAHRPRGALDTRRRRGSRRGSGPIRQPRLAHHRGCRR